jgi:hypothetical protein
MLGKFFSKKPKREAIFAYAHINARIMPAQRDEFFEQPLIEALAFETQGSEPIAEVTGSGSMQDKTGELLFCGIDLDIFDLDAATQLICALLTAEGAPKGSRLEYTHKGKDIKVPFGESECLAIYLNGTDLPAEVYEAADIDKLADEINAAIAPVHGSIWGSWQGPTETAAYCYGPSFDAMHTKLLPIFAKTALCEKCRVVQLA